MIFFFHFSFMSACPFVTIEYLFVFTIELVSVMLGVFLYFLFFFAIYWLKYNCSWRYSFSNFMLCTEYYQICSYILFVVIKSILAVHCFLECLRYHVLVGLLLSVCSIIFFCIFVSGHAFNQHYFLMKLYSTFLFHYNVLVSSSVWYHIIATILNHTFSWLLIKLSRLLSESHVFSCYFLVTCINLTIFTNYFFYLTNW